MRYTTTQAAKPAKKPFNMAEATASLYSSLESLHLAYDEVVAAEGRVTEAEQFLTDCATALESIKSYGITTENMSVLNRGNNLDEALGLEKLACEAIESLSESSKKLLQSQYVAGLEELADDNKKSFIQKCKDFLVKVWNWLKEFFVSDAKVIAMLKECKFEGTISADKQIVGLKYEDAKVAYGNLVTLRKAVCDISPTESDDELNGGVTESLKPAIRDRGTCADLGWDAAKAAQFKQKLIEEMPSRSKFKEGFDNLMKKAKDEIDTEMKGIAASTDSTFKKAAAYTAGYAAKGLLGCSALMSKFRAVSLYDKNFRTLAFTLIAINNAMQTAPVA